MTLSRKAKRRLVALVVAIALGGAVWVAGLVRPEWFLVADTPAPKTIGAVIVLGGEPWTRPPRAAEVYQAIKTETLKQRNIETFPLSAFSLSAFPTGPFVIVSGNGDCQDVRRQLEAREVPADRILTECDSKSTHENALFSVKLLRERHITNAVIVTSWYHSRRALACFRDVAPEITFYSSPTIRPVQKSWWPDKYERQRITQEYAKILYYWVVYGVNPIKSCNADTLKS